MGIPISRIFALQAQLQTPNDALWAQAYPSEQAPYMDSMAMDSLYESELNAQMLAAGKKRAKYIENVMNANNIAEMYIYIYIFRRVV